VTARAATGRPKKAPKHARRLPFAVVVAALVLGGLALLLALNTAAAANELRRHDYATRDQALAAELEQLRIEIAASAAPGNLASAAAALGMVPAGNPAFIVDAHGRLIVRGKPLPVPQPVVPVSTHPSAPKTSTTPATSPKPKPSTTSSTAADTTAPAHGKRHHPAAHPTPTTSPAPSPTPTPTPTVTLPGGPR
jgi:hypothetical protein